MTEVAIITYSSSGFGYYLAQLLEQEGDKKNKGC